MKSLDALKGPPSKGEGSAKVDAAKDLIAAVKAGDAKAVAMALERAYEACGEGEEESDEEDGGPDSERY